MNTNSLSWHTPPPDLALPPNEVHIWRADLDAPSTVVQHYGTLLSPSEHARAQRYVFDHDRRRWTIARATLRLLLSRYLDTRPELLEFDLNPFGKPSLATPYKKTPIQFN